jgi:hypothetical protein
VAVDGLVDQVGTVLGRISAEGEGQLAARVDAAVEDVGDGVAGLLARQTSPEDGAVIRVSSVRGGLFGV